MARKRLLALAISILLLCSIYWFSPLCDHSSPRNAYNELLQDQNEVSNQESLDIYDPPPVIDEKDVVILSKNNFSHVMSKNRYVLVEFYAPWCYWSKTLAPEYAAAATMLKGEAVIAKVDCTVEIELAKESNIQGYPTLNFYIDGVKVDTYYGERKRDNISAWVRKTGTLDSFTITTTEEAKRILTSESVLVLGFLEALEGADAEEFYAASKLETDVKFYRTVRADVATVFNIDPQIKRPVLVMVKKETEEYIFFQFFGSQFNSLNIAEFVSLNKVPSINTVILEQAPPIMLDSTKQVWLYATQSESMLIISTLQEAANAFKEKVLQAYFELSPVIAPKGQIIPRKVLY